MTKNEIIKRIIDEATEYAKLSDECLNNKFRLEAESNLRISEVLLKLAKEFNDEEINNGVKYYS